MRRSACLIGSLLLTALSPAAPAHAAFHLMKIAEVFAGTPAAPNARYVVLQMYAGGQNIVGNHSIQVFDSSNVLVGTFTFGGSVANGANQAKILVATPEAATFFGVSADLAMTPVIPAAGGKICFDTIDCVAWGNYGGPSTGVGTPFNAGDGILGQAIARRLDIAGSPTLLESGDDTGNSANDFAFATPAPRNNAGSTGSVPAATCGNGALEGLEECDDNNLENGDGCSSTCTSEVTVGVDPRASGLSLLLATPNPSRHDVSLQFTLSRPGDVLIGIHNLLGRQVRVIRASLAAGSHRLTWDGRDESGSQVAAGVYAVRARGGDLTASTLLVRIH